MMDRCVLLPFTGDPFNIQYWIKSYEKWQDKAKLYVYINSDAPQETKDYCENFLKEHGIWVDSSEHKIDHGPAINKLLDASNEKYVMLIEEDAFVFKPEIIDTCFNDLESGEFD